MPSGTAMLTHSGTVAVPMLAAPELLFSSGSTHQLPRAAPAAQPARAGAPAWPM
jgi:hypothetical protein